MLLGVIIVKSMQATGEPPINLPWSLKSRLTVAKLFRTGRTLDGARDMIVAGH